jgi:predicted secreted protein
MKGNTDAAVIHVVHGSVLIGAFVIFWFLALFCLLPVGLGDVDRETGAPLSPRLFLKAGIASVIAVVLWAAFYAMIAFGVLDL